MSRGIVYLVGAGPGDPGLLTVRALELLRGAEVVAHDELVSAAILALVNPGAELLPVGRRRGRGRIEHRLHPEVLARAQAGRRVVRLKGGDPMVFGRGAEEAEDLAEAGVPFEIVPGISAALGAASSAGIPLTDRRCSASVTFMTGHTERPDHDAGTLVLYMSGHNLAERLQRLIEEGRSPATPAAYIENATQPDQHIVVGTLADLAMRVEGRQRGAPALVIVGEVVRFRDRIAWRERRPLSGRRVVVARARPGASQIAKELRDLGADVTEAPQVEAAAPSNTQKLDAALARIAAYGTVLFACEPGVERTLEHARRHPELVAALRKSTIVAIGVGAAAALRRAGLEPRASMDGACADELARHAARLRLGPNLLITSEEGRPSLVQDLSALGASVEVVPAYRLVRTFALEAGRSFDLVVLPSSSAAMALLTDEAGAALEAVPMIAMGPKTEEAARASGAKIVSRCRRDTVPSMMAAVVDRLAPYARERIRPTKSLARAAVETGSAR